MSRLQRDAMSARVAKLPYLPTIAPPYDNLEDVEEREEAMSSLGSLPTMLPPSSRSPQSSRPLRSLNRPRFDPDKYSPISASGYFSQAMNVQLGGRGIDVRAYYTPAIVSGEDDGPSTVVVCHHGAGYSGLSFACFAEKVTQLSNGHCGVLSFDARRHGKTQPLENADDTDLSIETLTQDLYELLRTLFPDTKESPTFLLVGHSMGGAVCVRTCPLLLENHYRVAGVVVLDVVEGSAMDALPHMMHLLESRPSSFESIEEAIHWHVQNQTLQNLHSARISLPPVFLKAEDDGKVKWRTPLESTSPYWSSWFKSLSSNFLACRAARLLILAGTDRLDKELMIGQMQGKFQMEVVADVGHMLHEDNPERIAEIVVDFWHRNERVIIGVKKVGDL